MAKKKEDGTKPTISSWEITAASLQKKLGGTSFFCMGDDSVQVLDVRVIPTGLAALDDALGVFGFPRGRIIEIYGQESTGKSTLALRVVSQLQIVEPNSPIVYVDLEHALDPVWMQKNGVSRTNLWVAQPDSAEDALNVVMQAVESGQVPLVILDSVAALASQDELDGEVGDQAIGKVARLMGQFCRKVVGPLKRHSSTLICVNQIRCLPLTSIVLRNGRLCHLSESKEGDLVLERKGIAAKIKGISASLMVEGRELSIKHRPPFKLSNNHQQPVISNGLNIYKAGSEISIGDWLIQPILSIESISNENEKPSLMDQVSYAKSMATLACKDIELPTNLDDDLAFFLGCCYSDGNLFRDEEKSDYRMQFTEHNRERFELISNSVKKLFPESCYSISEKQSKIALWGQQVYYFLSALGCKSHGQEKTIPAIILRSRRSIIKHFIRGAFFDTHKFNRYGFISTHENIDATYEFSKVLYYMGIFADVRGKYLYLTGEDAIRFREDIGFAEPEKQKKALQFTSSNGARGKYDVVPYEYGLEIFNTLKDEKIRGTYKHPYYSSFKMCLFKRLNISRSRLIDMLQPIENKKLQEATKFLSSHRFNRVEKITTASFQAIDIETDSGLFIADQFLTHNSKIGPYGGETRPGGNALKFFASQIIKVRKSGDLAEDGLPIGIDVEADIKKNKVAPPHRTAIVSMFFNSGFSKELSLLDIASEMGIVDKSGAWYSYNGERLGQGRVNTAMAMSPTIFNEIYEKFKVAKMSSRTVMKTQEEPEGEPAGELAEKVLEVK